MVIHKMLYFLLFLHYGFYVFFTMCFAAYIYAATKNNLFKVISTLLLTLYSCIEFAWIMYVVVYLKLDLVALCFWTAGVILSLIIICILHFMKKADITIWFFFCIFFSPIIIIPVLIFIASVRKTEMLNIHRSKY